MASVCHHVTSPETVTLPMRMLRSLVLICAVTHACRGSHEAPAKVTPSRTPGALRCTTSIDPGLIVEIRDARTERWIADSAIVIARSVGYADTLRAGAFGRDGLIRDRRGVYERAGTYALEVRRPGYQTWQDSGVVVTSGVCHVNTLVLRVDLQPNR